MAPSPKAAIISTASIVVSVAVLYHLLKPKETPLAKQVEKSVEKQEEKKEEEDLKPAHPKPVTEKAFSLKTRKAVDEDALLTAEDNEEKVAKMPEDCSTKRRACKNCVCGRAEAEAKAEAEGAEFQPPPGGCGNCAKGDAFRCAGCPMRGKPAWNADEQGKVLIDLTDDV